MPICTFLSLIYSEMFEYFIGIKEYKHSTGLLLVNEMNTNCKMQFWFSDKAHHKNNHIGNI